MKRIGLILVILLGIVFLAGCYCCPTCPPVSQNCSLTITAGYWVWGTVYINGQSTGQYIDFSIPELMTATIELEPYYCNQWVCIIIVDPCGEQSHAEWVQMHPGSNYLFFAYW